MVPCTREPLPLHKLTLICRNENLSNIAAGYIVNSPSKGVVQAYITSKNGLESSVFNYAKVTKAGLVDNTLITYTANSSAPPTVWRDYVNSNFPVFEKTILIDSSAVYTGLVTRRVVEDPVAAVSTS
jgi:hypothetical protein